MVEPKLIVDGITYNLYTPDNEPEFEQYVSDNSKKIFGGNSFYFNIKSRIENKSGIGTIPDAYAIVLSDRPTLYIVEVELSTHRVYEHMIAQLTKFITSLSNEATKRDIVETLHSYISSDPILKTTFQQKIGEKEMHKFLNDLISNNYEFAIIIDKRISGLKEASEALKIVPEVVEFQTYVREHSNNTVRIHLIDSPLYKEESTLEPKTLPQQPAKTVDVRLGGKTVQVTLEQIVKASNNPEINNFGYRTRYAEISGKKYSIKGLVSLATGIPVTEFNTLQALPILERLGISCHVWR